MKTASVFSCRLRLSVLRINMSCQPKKSQNLAELNVYSQDSKFSNFRVSKLEIFQFSSFETRDLSIFEFQNSKSFNFRVLKLEICQFSSFKKMRQNDEERTYLNYLHQVKCSRMISPAKSVITLRVRPDKV